MTVTPTHVYGSKMYNIAAHTSGGNEDHMAGYFSLVMGKAPLLWLDNFQMVRSRQPTGVLIPMV
jgi:hypothetical protein